MALTVQLPRRALISILTPAWALVILATILWGVFELACSAIRTLLGDDFI